MGGGTGLSNIASSMYAAASMNNAASATVTAQASPEIHNAAAEPTLLEKAHNILDILGCFSDIPDGINALLYLYEGNQKEAALCAICFLPFGDAISKGRKVALNAIPEIAEFAGKHADEAVDSYKALRKIANKGDEVHHLIEKRLVRKMDINPMDMPSIILSKEEHRVFTNLWRNQIPYKSDYSILNPDSIMEKAKIVYKDYPELLDACWATFRGMK